MGSQSIIHSQMTKRQWAYRPNRRFYGIFTSFKRRRIAGWPRFTPDVMAFVLPTSRPYNFLRQLQFIIDFTLENGESAMFRKCIIASRTFCTEFFVIWTSSTRWLASVSHPTRYLLLFGRLGDTIPYNYWKYSRLSLRNWQIRNIFKMSL
jgi:hypothetical protein